MAAKIVKGRGIVEVDASKKDEIENWDSTIYIDEQDAVDPIKSYREIPSDWVRATHTVGAAATRGGEQQEKRNTTVNPEFEKRPGPEKATYNYMANVLIVDASPPKTHEEIALAPCDTIKEKSVAKDNIFKKYFNEIKQIPTFAALKDDYKIRLFECPDDGNTWCKCATNQEVIYFDEEFLQEQLLKHRGIDIAALQGGFNDRGPGGGDLPPAAPLTAYDKLTELEAYHVDMTMEKLMEDRAGDITRQEERDFISFLATYPDKNIKTVEGEPDITFIKTEVGTVVFLDEINSCYEHFAFVDKNGESQSTLTLDDGENIKLENFLKEKYHVNLEGNEIKEIEKEEKHVDNHYENNRDYEMELG